jgi:hypothetical protein
MRRSRLNRRSRLLAGLSTGRTRQHHHASSAWPGFDARRALPIDCLPVIRALATFLALAALAASGPGAMLHVHAYEGHDHPDHHHGPAAHSHGQGDHYEHQDKKPGPRIEACDPGAHALTVVFTCVSPTAHQAPLADTTVADVTSPATVVVRGATITDVRAHSPPRLTDAPLRAPPVVHPA